MSSPLPLIGAASDSLLHNRPARQALSIGQRRALLSAMLALCALGAGGSALVIVGLRYGDAGPGSG